MYACSVASSVGEWSCMDGFVHVILVPRQVTNQIYKTSLLPFKNLLKHPQWESLVTGWTCWNRSAGRCFRKVGKIFICIPDCGLMDVLFSYRFCKCLLYNGQHISLLLPVLTCSNCYYSAVSWAFRKGVWGNSLQSKCFFSIAWLLIWGVITFGRYQEAACNDPHYCEDVLSPCRNT